MRDLDRLNRSERLQLMKFLCAVVWSDLDVNPSERTWLLSLALRLGLSGNEVEQVKGWIEVPPQPEDVDPGRVRPELRQLYLDAVEEVITADAAVDPPEAESLRLLRELLIA